MLILEIAAKNQLRSLISHKKKKKYQQKNLYKTTRKLLMAMCYCEAWFI